MIPIKLHLHNFLSYQNPLPLDFSSFDLAVLSGDNGAGKSSILEALTWAIWEKTRASSSDDLIHQGTTEMWVDFSFEHEGQIYRVFRKRSKKKSQSSLEFQIKEKNNNLLDDEAWKTISEATLRATQEKIIQTLKLPYEIFVNSSYLRQGRADEFTVKTPSERKEILGEILGLGDWEILQEKAKNKVRTIQNQNEALNFQIEDLKFQISQNSEVEGQLDKAINENLKLKKQEKEINLKFDKFDNQKRKKDLLAEKIKTLRDRWAELKNEINNLQEEAKNINRQLESFDNTLKNKSVINKDYQKYKKLQEGLEKLESKKDQYLALREKLIYFALQKNELVDKIKKINDISTCPTCLRPLKVIEQKEIIKHLEDEFAKENLFKIDKLEKEIKKNDYNEDLHRRLKTLLQKMANSEEQKRHLDVAQSQFSILKQQLEKLREHIDRKNNQIKSINQQGERLKRILVGFKDLDSLWQNAFSSLKDIRNKLLESESNLGALKQTLELFKKQKSELILKEKQQKENLEQEAIYEELVMAFSKKGIQAMIIEQALPLIEEEANYILAKVSNGKMKVRFITQKSKKSAEEELIETLEIKISDGAGERDYEMFSGGEAFRINFAIRVALSKFLSLRSGLHLRFLVLDEGFGTLDTTGRETLAETINSIRQDFAKIIVITHIEEIRDMFPTQILATKDQSGSHLEVVG